jgi:hypothetical protein
MNHLGDGVLKLLISEPRLQNRELLVKKSRGSRRQYGCPRGCRSEALQHRLGGDIRDVAQHALVLPFVLQFRCPDQDWSRAKLFASESEGRDRNVAHVLLGSQPSGQSR